MDDKMGERETQRPDFFPIDPIKIIPNYISLIGGYLTPELSRCKLAQCLEMYYKEGCCGFLWGCWISAGLIKVV
jgi:hypothetical protein